MADGVDMNRCENWKICPLGDTAKLIGCRKPGCPTKTVADTPRQFTKEVVIKKK